MDDGRVKSYVWSALWEERSDIFTVLLDLPV